MVDNPVCIQVDWDTNSEYLAAWREVENHSSTFKWAHLKCSRQPGCPVFPLRLGLGFPSLMPSWLSWGRRDGSTTWPDMLLHVSSPGETCGSVGRKVKRLKHATAQDIIKPFFFLFNLAWHMLISHCNIIIIIVLHSFIKFSYRQCCSLHQLYVVNVYLTKTSFIYWGGTDAAQSQVFVTMSNLFSSEGFWGAVTGWGLGSECWELAVAFSQCFLSPVLQGLLPCGLWKEDRQKWDLHQVRLRSDWLFSVSHF